MFCKLMLGMISNITKDLEEHNEVKILLILILVYVFLVLSLFLTIYKSKKDANNLEGG